MPSATAASGPSIPAPAVDVAKPATAPLATPNTVGFPRCFHSASIHARAAETAVKCVTVTAPTAVAFAPRALPPLKPNQPSHNKPAPNKIKGKIGRASCRERVYVAGEEGGVKRTDIR